ncbi:MAG: hypothetical protein EBY30_03225 [Rhodospirillales bacterium]|nr:hypothetical protein [Rhodospirillales bacterium]
MIQSGTQWNQQLKGTGHAHDHRCAITRQWPAYIAWQGGVTRIQQSLTRHMKAEQLGGIGRLEA